MKVRLTRRRLAVLTAIHENGEAAPSTICHTTGFGPGTVYPALDVFERAEWIGWRPHPTRKGARLYHLTFRGQLGSGLQPAAGDDGPSVADCAADDQRWPLEKAGE